MITTLLNIVRRPYYEQAYYQPTAPIFDLQKYLYMFRLRSVDILRQ